MYGINASAVRKWSKEGIDDVGTIQVKKGKVVPVLN
jgi:hypothetical protein